MVQAGASGRRHLLQCEVTCDIVTHGSAAAGDPAIDPPHICTVVQSLWRPELKFEDDSKASNSNKKAASSPGMKCPSSTSVFPASHCSRSGLPASYHIMRAPALLTAMPNYDRCPCNKLAPGDLSWRCCHIVSLIGSRNSCHSRAIARDGKQQHQQSWP